ncbi:hypothetical protein A0128_19505 [Leptospira tipperaryensis]|uniref:Lipoprotein n=1 Tax=Leptospira tipperaryensis TaxID=2564040 RepID=A0A1D7V312_9LEPT|nr:hypothetical protein [Leptospira tipperaryensis]AOP36220.1 hypothetical protein A0128_19505 [Leptospira tipperaryensis]
MYQNRTLAILSFSLFFLVFSFTFCKDDSSEDKNQIGIVTDTTESDSEMEKTWIAFANSVEQNDHTEFKKLSTKQIDCMDCLLSEEESLTDLNPIAAYKRYYSDPNELSSIPINQFLQKNHSNVFDEETKKALKDPNRYSVHRHETNQETQNRPCILSDQKSRNSKGYEVLVTVHKPLLGSESTQKVFSFMQTKTGLKFCGTYSIP